MGLIQAKRDQIVTAALAEFREQGFAGASMDRIAARASVSKRTVYNHFENKESLYGAIIDQLMAQVATALDIRYQPDRPIRDQLLDLGWGVGRLLLSPTFIDLAAIVMSETIRDPALGERFLCQTVHMDALTRFMTGANAAGALRVENVTEAADQFLGLIKAQAFWPALISGQPVTEDRMAQVIAGAVETFLARYGVGTGAASGRLGT